MLISMPTGTSTIFGGFQYIFILLGTYGTIAVLKLQVAGYDVKEPGA